MEDYLSRISCEDDEEYFLDKLQRIFGGYPCLGVPPEPTQVVRGVYVGTIADAENTDNLHRQGITHIINCSGSEFQLAPLWKDRMPYKFIDKGIKGYIQLNADDSDIYDISGHFNRCVRYIKTARHTGGNVLICGSGVSRSGTICMAYLLAGKNMYLLEAARMLKDARRTVLCNVNFMCQLVHYAKDHQLFDICPDRVRSRRFGGDYDRYRVHSASLPDVDIREPFRRSTRATPLPAAASAAVM